jgi:hypothetical protein
VLGSVAEGASGSRRLDPLFGWVDRLPAALIGAGLIAVALAAYWLPGTDRFYNHFVWQALAFLHGTAVIDWPQPGNEWMQDIYPLSELDGTPTGALLPFPPLPAILLLPFVAVWGLATDIRAVSVGVGAIGVGIAWWALGGLAVSRRIRLATTIFFALGTVYWYAAQLGTTWFFAHVCAVAFALLAVGLAVRSDPDADGRLEAGEVHAAGTGWSRRDGVVRSAPRAVRSAVWQLAHPLSLVDGRQFAAGLLFGIACTARLTVVFGAPFFMLVGGGGSWLRRSVSAGLGASIPVALLLAYNLATTGQVLHPGYEWQYQQEARDYQILGYHEDWSIEDIRYLPQNLQIFLGATPALAPEHDLNVYGQEGEALCADGAVRSLFDRSCPIAVPRAIGMSLLLTIPAYLLALAAFLRRRSRLVAGSTLAVLAIAFVNLLHFSQGWVNFGYRFSNDFVVFALPLVAVGMARRGGVGWLGAGLIVLSIAINLWGVIWGNILGW